jgi:hypothetical protein
MFHPQDSQSIKAQRHAQGGASYTFTWTELWFDHGNFTDFSAPFDDIP